MLLAANPVPLILLALVIGANAAAAPPGFLAMIEATEVQAEGGTVMVADGWVIEIHGIDDDPPTPTIVFESDWMRVELDRRVQPISSPVGGDAPLAENDILPVYEGPGRLEATAAQRAHSVVVNGAHAAGEWTTDSFVADPLDARQEESRRSPATVRDPEPVSFAGTVRAQSPTGRIALEGPMDLSAWGVNFTLHTPNGTIDIWTGTRYEPYHDGVSAVPYGQREEGQELWVFSEQAKGEFSFPAPWSNLYAWDPTTHVEERVTLIGDGGHEETHDGPLDMTLRNAGSVLEVELAEVETPSGQDDDPRLSPLESAVRIWEAPPWVAISAMAAAVVLLAAVATVHSRNRWASVEAAMDFGMYSVVVRRSRPFLRSRRRRAEAALLHGLGLVHTQQAAAAEAFLDGHPAARALDPGTQHYLRALIHCSQGDTAQAREAVANCLAADASLAAKVQSEPMLRPILAIAADDAYA